jgi:hypothetical protein
VRVLGNFRVRFSSGDRIMKYHSLASSPNTWRFWKSRKSVYSPCLKNMQAISRLLAICQTVIEKVSQELIVCIIFSIQLYLAR